MKWIAQVQTRDGRLHNDAPRAKAHAENLYGEALSALAHRAVRVEKYSAMMEFIAANLDAFVELKALHDDIALEKTDIFGE